MRLSVRIFRNENGGYTAVCPSLPGCMCRGETREETMSRIDEAVKGYIAALNNFVPENLVNEVIEV